MLFNRSKKMMNAGKALALLLLPVLLLLAACGEEETPVYTVTFNANGGSAIEPEKVESGKQATKPTDPTRAEYTFGGWYSDKALSKVFDFTKPITADITLYAKWDVNTYTVTFNNDGDTSAETVNSGATVAEPTAPTRAGHTFGGWYTDSGFNTAYDFDTPVTQNITLYAKWDIITYTVSFNTNGGSAVEPVTVESGKPVAKPKDPDRAAYGFAGWYSDEALTDAYDFDTPITQDITLYAKWGEDVMVTYDESTGTITGLAAKYENAKDVQLEIPATINGVKMTTIAAGAFKEQMNIISIDIAEGIETIGGTVENGAFQGCTGLKGDLSLPSTLTTIEEYVFEGCSSFTGDLTIGSEVTTIGDFAFANCSGFDGILTIGDAVTTIGDYAFSECSGLTGTLTVGDAVTTIGDSAFSGCSGFDGTLTIGDAVTTIGDYAFSECEGFTGDLNIPNSVTAIGESAFSECTGFDGTLTIGNAVTTIGFFAFSECSGLKGELTIPNSVTTIGDFAFSDCTGLTGTLTIGNAVTTIGDFAFSETDFTTVVALPVVPPEIVSDLGLDADPTFPDDLKAIRVPAASVAAYQAADGWINYSSIITAQ